MQQLKITVDPLGRLTVEAEGFQGASCLEATRRFLELGRPREVTLKPEYYQEGLTAEYLKEKP